MKGQVSCAGAGCGKIFSAPGLGMTQFRKALYAAKWVNRGSPDGMLYYCGDHAPRRSDLPDRPRRKKENER